MSGKLLIIDVAALGWNLLDRTAETELASLPARPMQSILPAVTCTAQGSFRTASAPGEHGMVANGLHLAEAAKVMFWEQSAALVEGRRIWEGFRSGGRRVGMMFWQQSLGENVDLVLSPAPIHKHHGGMIMDCYSRPGDLYPRLRDRLGKFRLGRYWGPLASPKVGDWIASATVEVLGEPAWAPDLLLVYLPTLDYDLQRYGPGHRKTDRAMEMARRQLAEMTTAATETGYDVLIFGDYAIAGCDGPALLPNRALREAKLMAARAVDGMLYPDLYTSRAFAMVDHEVAHVYAPRQADRDEAMRTLETLDGVAEILPREQLADRGLDHRRSGDLILLAEPGHWFAYPWWDDKRSAPDYATHIDIHNKPGFDPCELFFGWPPGSVSLDTTRIRGSHGRTAPDREVAWATTLDLDEQPEDLIALAGAVGRWLDQQT